MFYSSGINSDFMDGIRPYFIEGNGLDNLSSEELIEETMKRGYIVKQAPQDLVRVDEWIIYGGWLKV